MKKYMITALLVSGITLIGTATYAKQSMKAIMADEAPPEPPDPKKKKAGEDCKSSDECQRHHSCQKSGEKGVCTAPPRSKIPPGAVT